LVAYDQTMPNLPDSLPIIILTLTTCVATIFYLREYNKRQSLEKEGEKILQNFREKGLETLHESVKKSQDILGQAEIESIKVVADTRVQTGKLEGSYKQTLDEVAKQSQVVVQDAQNNLLVFIQQLQKQAQELERFSQEETKARINQIFGRMEERLSDFLVSTEQKTLSSIELEIKSTKELLENYKNAQLKAVDENVLAIMEQTLSVVLGKKLSLKDQLDLIYEALEKAKGEKFLT